jgi:AcrR family transcriptional regulator
VPKVTQAHRDARRRQILDGARRTFGRDGYQGATVPRLEAEIGLSRGAIFSYFPSKLDLFLALAEGDQQQLGELWLEQGFDAVVRHVGESPEWIGAYLDVARMLRADGSLRDRWAAFNPGLQARLAASIVDRQEQGELRGDVSVETVGRFLGVVLDGLAVQQGAGFGVDVDGTLALVRSALEPE